MTTIFVFRGLPGSGKTTKALEMVGPRVTYVNRDSIRAALGITSGVGAPEQEATVTLMEDAAIKGGLAAGHDVVVDATNLNNKFAKRFYDFGADQVFFNDVVVPISVAIAQDTDRFFEGGRRVGADIIRSIAKRYKVQEDGTLPAPPKGPLRPDLTPVAEWDDELPTAIIVDTDGTLANHTGIRSPYDTSKYHLDTVHGNVAAIINTLAESTFVLGVSGRDERFADVTLQWWREHARLVADEFYMRPKGDKRPDDVIKAEIYEQHIRGRFNVIGVFDDRGRVLRMWRAKGFTTFAVGDTDNYNF